MKTSKLMHVRGGKGQAMVEFALIATILLFMVFAGFEGSRYASLSLRIASSTREAGRLYVSEEIEPDYITTSSGYNANIAKMRPMIQSNVFNPITNMVYPSDLIGQGKVIFSVLRRFDNGQAILNNNPPLAPSATTNTTDDRILIEYQFVFPNTNSFPTWTSQLGVVGNQVSTDLFPTESLSIDERTIAVEIYQQTDFIAPTGILNWVNFNYVYDRSIF